MVMDSISNLPLADVLVTATFGDFVETAITDVDGRFALYGILETEGLLQFETTGYTTAALGVALEPLEVLDLGQVRLRPEDVTRLLPDLQVGDVDTIHMQLDDRTLELAGAIAVEVANPGTSSAAPGTEVLAYYDHNLNETFEADVDMHLGVATSAAEIAPGDSETVVIEVGGSLPYRDAPLRIWVDSAQSVIELDEENNMGSTAKSCRVRPELITFEPVLKWQLADSGSESPPVVAQMSDDNGDGVIDAGDIPDVIYVALTGSNRRSRPEIRVVSGADGTILVSIDGGEDAVGYFSSLAVGDIDNDNRNEIVRAREAGGVVVYRHDGTLLWRNSENHNGYTNQGASPAIADLDGDGNPEILLGRDVFNWDGTHRWIGEGDFYGAAGGESDFYGSFAMDLAPDAGLEIVVGASLLDSDGTLLWQADQVGDGHTAVADLDDDGVPDLVVLRRNRLWRLEPDGTVVWGPVTIPGGLRGGLITLADVDGDGLPEIGVPGRSAYGLFDRNGSLLWQAPIWDWSAITGTSSFDFDGDGRAEILYGDSSAVRAYDGITGAVLFEIPNGSLTAREYPVVADIDGDGHAELLTVGTTEGLRAFDEVNDSWVATRSIWNQAEYHVDNVHDDGAIPVNPQPSWLSHNG